MQVDFDECVSCARRSNETIRELRQQVQATQAKIERHDTLLELAAQLLDQAAVDIDRMFPGDEHPEMQTDLRRIASRFREELKEVPHG